MRLYVIEISDSAGILQPFAGTTQAGIDGQQQVLLGVDLDGDGITNDDVDGVIVVQVLEDAVAAEAAGLAEGVRRPDDLAGPVVPVVVVPSVRAVIDIS